MNFGSNSSGSTNWTGSGGFGGFGGLKGIKFPTKPGGGCSPDIFKNLNNSNNVTWDDFLRNLNCNVVPPKDALAPYQPPLYVGVIVYYYLAIFWGVVLNGLVLYTISRQRRLRTMTNAFMCSLNTADFLMASLVIPLRITDMLRTERAHKEPGYVDEMNLGLVVDILFPLIGVASIFNLCAVTLERYLSITSPLTYDTHITPLRACIALFLIWFVSIFQAVIPLVWQGLSYENLLHDLRLAFALAAPFLLILFAYGKIFLVARKHARQIAAQDVTNREESSSSYNFFKKLKVVKIIALLIGAFVLCWFPFFIFTAYEPVILPTDEKYPAFIEGRQITECLTVSTCLLNPLLYAGLRKDLRKALVTTIKCKKRDDSDGITTNAMPM